MVISAAYGRFTKRITLEKRFLIQQVFQIINRKVVSTEFVVGFGYSIGMTCGILLMTRRPSTTQNT